MVERENPSHRLSSDLHSSSVTPMGVHVCPHTLTHTRQIKIKFKKEKPVFSRGVSCTNRFSPILPLCFLGDSNFIAIIMVIVCMYDVCVCECRCTPITAPMKGSEDNFPGLSLFPVDAGLLNKRFPHWAILPACDLILSKVRFNLQRIKVAQLL